MGRFTVTMIGFKVKKIEELKIILEKFNFSDIDNIIWTDNEEGLIEDIVDYVDAKVLTTFDLDISSNNLFGSDIENPIPADFIVEINPDWSEHYSILGSDKDKYSLMDVFLDNLVFGITINSEYGGFWYPEISIPYLMTLKDQIETILQEKGIEEEISIIPFTVFY